MSDFRYEFSLASFNDLRTSAQTFEALAAPAWLTIDLTGGDRPERGQGMRVKSRVVDMLKPTLQVN